VLNPVVAGRVQEAAELMHTHGRQLKMGHILRAQIPCGCYAQLDVSDLHMLVLHRCSKGV
jgi:hypothetical protein